MERFKLKGMAWRMAFSVALVLLSFNPSGHSYYHWVSQSFPSFSPVELIAGLVLLGLWIFFVNSTMRAMGKVGIFILMGVFASIVWWMVAQGWLALDSGSKIAWVVLVILGLVLGFGMSWAHIRRNVSGQASVDRVDK
jgi:hypothetical protein